MPLRYLQPSPVAPSALLLEMWGYFSFQAHLDFWAPHRQEQGEQLPVAGLLWDWASSSWREAVRSRLHVGSRRLGGEVVSGSSFFSEKIIFWNNWKCAATVRLRLALLPDTRCFVPLGSVYVQGDIIKDGKSQPEPFLLVFLHSSVWPYIQSLFCGGNNQTSLQTHKLGPAQLNARHVARRAPGHCKNPTCLYLQGQL